MTEPADTSVKAEAPDAPAPAAAPAPAPASPPAAESAPATRGGFSPAARELALLAGLYVLYSLVRSLASDSMAIATGNARDILAVERVLRLDVEQAWNAFFVDHHALAVASSFYYASAHFLVTAGVLIWLWRTRRPLYGLARTALAGATIVALAMYLLVPTAPPRLYGGYVDVLAYTSDVGWWGHDASSPKGLGGMTNELAAMPSMHVGWAVWCAVAVAAATRHLLVRIVAWLYPAATSVVVIGTGNHWTLDVLAGAAVVAAAWWTMRILIRRLAPLRWPL
ncbi:phosphatase PAP2 family protein [Demequina silvatica]|uniref:phosphatase PAP2 family protein n=1 Tax=Demequina silvatica TaxID=1638988 RepID=UPI000785EFA0|nr:phosphatase PAP2 family protein [Demequina silvatica]